MAEALTAGLPAHPRSRGENCVANLESPAAGGSSPLTRGKRRRRQLLGRTPGLIPAHAGKTGCSSARGSSRRAHPRSRGENTTVGTMPGAGPGSSPLTRGKRHAACPRRTVKRLIPAHAGKTHLTPIISRPAGAHPRSRGENRRARNWIPSAAGSSPLTRGKRSWRSCRRSPLWLIPAHAGKTGGTRSRSCGHWAHPRSRGENEIARAEDVNANGSSPLTRGKR